MSSKILLGLEIEGVFNRDLNAFSIGRYHNGHATGKYWKCEEDGSLRRSFKYSQEECAEFVSNIIKSKLGLKNALKEFKNIITNGEEYELNEVCYFNKSCGCHIHIGLNDSTKKISHLLDYKYIIKFRDEFFKRLNGLDIDPEAKQSIKKHYFRGYAKKTTTKKFYTSGRYKEFNLLSDEENQGLEWRSFNLYNIKTFDDLNKVLILVYDLIREYFLFPIQKGYNTRKKNIKIKEDIINRFKITNPEKIVLNKISLEPDTIQKNMNDIRRGL